MISLGFFNVLLFAIQASSSPVPIEQSTADVKVMRCVVEVISDTLSKPSSLPISQQCMDVLRGDERIISVLRHQNLLRELQEIAAEGANEKELHKKLSSDFNDNLAVAVKNHIDKTISSADKSHETPTEEQQGSSAETLEIKDKEQDSIQGTQPNVSGYSFLTMTDKTSDSNSDVADSRDMATEKEEAVREAPVTNGSSEEESSVQQSQDQSRSEEHSPEESEQIEDEYAQEEEVDEGKIKESGEELEEDHSDYNDNKNEPLSNDEERSQEDGETREVDRNQSEAKELSELEGDGTVSEEDIRANENNMSHQNSEDEDVEEDEYSNISDEKDGLSEEEWEERKKWKKMGELAPERNSKKHGEMSDEDRGVLERKSKFTGRANPNPHNKLSNSQYSWGNRRSHSEEGIRKKKPIPSYPRKRTETEDKKEKEEEGSANRKNEEQELENLEAIESELEAMARRLHQMRRS
ncbi:chromogranin-A-like [Scyliorhinus canicula]|uniref:chromogranin-A-like n=1 Tax=Scyliorhinus canicula TaxID=7830 RepID=UPI0018F680F2|nr:chromogranin-A-like [Scyliorhinus canicula]